mmetsp:Transcript_98168/g.300160  ORF Transcript_98168/g.300160 Transcript_98168/m.300160 type:complete len:246 (+) Transcript_98168:387-1124(+)
MGLVRMQAHRLGDNMQDNDQLAVRGHHRHAVLPPWHRGAALLVEHVGLALPAVPEQAALHAGVLDVQGPVQRGELLLREQRAQAHPCEIELPLGKFADLALAELRWGQAHGYQERVGQGQGPPDDVGAGCRSSSVVLVVVARAALRRKAIRAGAAVPDVLAVAALEQRARQHDQVPEAGEELAAQLPTLHVLLVRRVGAEHEQEGQAPADDVAVVPRVAEIAIQEQLQAICRADINEHDGDLRPR